MIKRVALIGASSTGKSTVFELLKTKLDKYHFVNESTRSVAKFGFPINEQGTDATQLAISSFHLKALHKAFDTIYDRCFLDLVVYTKYMDQVNSETKNFINDMWESVKSDYTHYIYFPIEFKSVDDGVRSVNEKWRRKIDKEFVKELKSMKKDYLTVTGSPMQRVDQILKYIQ